MTCLMAPSAFILDVRLVIHFALYSSILEVVLFFHLEVVHILLEGRRKCDCFDDPIN